jgi:hypothetical protein
MTEMPTTDALKLLPLDEAFVVDEEFNAKSVPPSHTVAPSATMDSDARVTLTLELATLTEIAPAPAMADANSASFTSPALTETLFAVK